MTRVIVLITYSDLWLEDMCVSFCLPPVPVVLPGQASPTATELILVCVGEVGANHCCIMGVLGVMEHNMGVLETIIDPR